MAADQVISQRLREFRKNRGLTQEGIAAAANMRQTTWAGWEKKPPDALEWLAALARHYNVSTDYLLGLTNDPTPHYEPDDAPVYITPEADQVAELVDAMSQKNRTLMLELARALADR